MENSDWKVDLADFFADIKIIEQCKEQTIRDFEQLCEFIAEPAFESLAGELQNQDIKAKFKRSEKKSIDFQINFPGSKTDHFHYIIMLPKNSVELKLRLLIKGRKSKDHKLERMEKPFLENIQPFELLKLSKDVIIKDVIEHYKNFIYETISKP